MKNFLRTTAATLLLVAMVTLSAHAGTQIAAPELDAHSGMTAAALVAGVLLVAADFRRKRN